MNNADTILAIASPPGRAPRGIIRCSGPATFDLLAAHLALHAVDERATPLTQTLSPEGSGLLPPSPPGRGAGGEGSTSAPARNTGREDLPRGLHAARLRLGPHDLPVLALVFPGPRSSTGEDAAELHLPGNPDLLERVIDALLERARALHLDARRAGPGEFTARAYLHGRLSLTQAEGVAGTIAARSDAELRAAALLREGAFGRLASGWADALAGLLALVEAGIDFTDEEDVTAISPADLARGLRALREEIATHLDRAVGMEQLEAIPWVVLTGRPNAGKSTLFNALLDRARAVVSDVPGTTRDVLAEPLAIDAPHGRAEVMLVDLAGAEDDECTRLDREMQAAARAARRRAELILHCVPLDEAVTADVGTIAPTDRSRRAPVLLVRTKADVVDDHGDDITGSIHVSAVTGEHVGALRRAIADRLGDHAVSLAADTFALQPRHEAALHSALAHLDEVLGLVAPAERAPHLPGPELAAASMRAALDELAALAGEITTDDVLGRIFATFCIGK